MDQTASASPCELRFQSLFDAGKALAFPCDERGNVALDQLSPRALTNYLFARAVIGREYATPAVLFTCPNRPAGR